MTGAGSPPAEPDISPRANQRIQELVRERDDQRARAAAIEAQARMIASQNQDLQNRLAQAQRPGTPAADPEIVALEQAATARLGNDEMGKAAHETISTVVQLEMKKALKGHQGGLGQEEVSRIVQNAVAQAMAPNAIQAQLQQWKIEGRIAEEDLPAVSQEMSEMLVEQPGWGQGENLQSLPVMALGRAMAKGKIKGRTVAVPQRPDGTPLQPGGPSSPERDAGDAQRVAEEVVNRFPRLAQQDPAKLAERFRATPMDLHHGEVTYGGRK